MATAIALTAAMKAPTACLQRVDRINSAATMANAFQAICFAVDRPNATTLQTKPLAIVNTSSSSSSFFSVSLIIYSKANILSTLEKELRLRPDARRTLNSTAEEVFASI